MDLTNKLPKIRGSYRFNVDLSKTTWFQVGGKADVLFRPQDISDLVDFLKNKDADLPVVIVGVGSNIIVRDGGIEGVVIKLGREFANITHENGILTAGAGALCGNVALYSKINGLTNLEFLTGIPGSIGGAIAMNAGCYDGEVALHLISAKAVDFSGNLVELKNEDFGFSYRTNKISKNFMFLEGKFEVKQSTSKEVGDKIAGFNKKREESQPIRSKTGGSTFKNPKAICGRKAWELIDEAGCRGLNVGDAQMSQKHCNFMINNGQAKSKDLVELGNKVIDKVKEKTGVTLEWEIKILGRDVGA